MAFPYFMHSILTYSNTSVPWCCPKASFAGASWTGQYRGGETFLGNTIYKYFLLKSLKRCCCKTEFILVVSGGNFSSALLHTPNMNLHSLVLAFKGRHWCYFVLTYNTPPNYTTSRNLDISHIKEYILKLFGRKKNCGCLV